MQNPWLKSFHCPVGQTRRDEVCSTFPYAEQMPAFSSYTEYWLSNWEYCFLTEVWLLILSD